eukprot:scaffold46837_cov63-Cyclotella_meneghiniana.AAC.3
MNDKVILLDGGMGHELKNRGLSDGTFLAGLMANEATGGDAAVVESIHYDFLAAGCDVVTTNSFVAVPPRMIECGLALDQESANARSVQLINAAVDRASAAIAKYNKYHSKEDCTGYKTIVTTLIKRNVDILLAETLSTSREAEAIIKTLSSLKDTNQNIIIPPLWISFTIHDDKPNQLRSGESLIDVCRLIINQAELSKIHIDAIGVNCSTPSSISVALKELNEMGVTGIKYIVYGNCFQKTTSEWIRSLNNDNNTSVGMNHHKFDEYDDEGYLLPEIYAKYAKTWAGAGASIIGGCCGCSPDHMKAVSSNLR